MNIINSVTGLNMNFNSGWNIGGNFNNPQNINFQGNYNYDEEDDDDDDEDEQDYYGENEEEENEEGENEFNDEYTRKRNKFILELDEFQ